MKCPCVQPWRLADRNCDVTLEPPGVHDWEIQELRKFGPEADQGHCVSKVIGLW